MGKAKKSTKKYIKSGQLDREIKMRRKNHSKNSKFTKNIKDKTKETVRNKLKTSSKDTSEPIVEEEINENWDNIEMDEFLDGKFFKKTTEELNEENEEETVEIEKQVETETPEENEVSLHMKEIEALKISDPELYAYFEREDPELLHFDESISNETEVDELGSNLLPGQIYFTQPLFRTLVHSMILKKSLISFRHLIIAFRSACKMTINEENEGSKDVVVYRYKMPNVEVFNHLMSWCFKNFEKVFDYFLPNQKRIGTNGDSSIPTPIMPNSSPKWKSIEQSIKSFLKSVLIFFQNITDSEMLIFILSNLKKYMRFVSCFPGLPRLFLKSLLHIWGTTESQKVRMQTFLSIRELGIKTPLPFFEVCLKGIYLTYVRQSKDMGDNTINSITVMRNCVVELYSIDFILSYQHAFAFIRQMAIHLRNCYKNKTENSIQTIYNWQFINSFRVFVQLFSDPKAKGPLQQLIYPLIQIILSTINLLPTPRYFPLRFHLIRLLHVLSYNNNLYINTSTYLFHILQNNEFLHRATHEGYAHVLRYTLKLSKNSLELRSDRDNLFNQFYVLLTEYFQIHWCDISFPEIVYGVLKPLKVYMRDCKNEIWCNKIKSLLNKLNLRMNFIIKERSNCKFCPNEPDKIASFLSTEKSKMKIKLPIELVEDDNVDEPIEKDTPKQKKPKQKKEKKSEPKTKYDDIDIEAPDEIQDLMSNEVDNWFTKDNDSD